MKLILAIGWLLIALPVESDDQVEKVLIGDGAELTIRESPNHRGVPHLYYDQAVESIKDLYPKSEVLVARRFGTLGEVAYSLVCYKEFKRSSKVVVGGMFAVGRRSWRFDGMVPVEGFTDSLVLILEAISKSPSSKTMEPDA